MTTRGIFVCGIATEDAVILRKTFLSHQIKSYDMFIIYTTNMEQLGGADLFNSQPVCQIPSIGQRRGQTYNSDRFLCVRGNEVRTGNNDLQNWSSVIPWKANNPFNFIFGFIFCEMSFYENYW